MTGGKGHALRFHCGVCAKKLTDETALFTSCGHFYCASSTSNCTRLRPGNTVGRCEQCGKECDAGTLTNRGEKYGQRVRSFVFGNLREELNTIAEILEFRDKHLDILCENVASQASRISTLKAEYQRQVQENGTLVSENDALRKQIDSLKRRSFNPSIPTSPPRRSDVPYAELAQDHGMRADVNGRRNALSVWDVDKNYSRDDVQQMKQSRPKPRARAPDLYEKAWGRSVANKKASPLSAADPILGRPSKRRWVEHPTASETPANREDRFVGDRFTSSRTTRVTGISRFASGNAKGTHNISRFARGNVASGIGNAEPRRELAERQQGDWQRRVSTVPRPSATPDRLGRRPAKRQRQGVNPLSLGRW